MEPAMNPTTTAVAPKSAFPRLAPLMAYLDNLGQAADLQTLRRLLEEIDVTRADLEPACLFKDDRYQRNLLGQTDFYELVCLCWASGQRTPIHDHKGSACAFLVVEGTATETRFEPTPSGLVIPAWTRHHEPGYICASGEADIHQVANVMPEGRELVTLHCYTPQLRNFNVYSLDTPCAGHPDTVRCFEPDGV